MKRILVTYESAHGSTEGIAQALGRRLTTAGLDADVRSIEQVGSLTGYDAVVVGSAIHNGSWLPRAASFVKNHTGELAERATWLFSVCSIGETTSFFGPRLSRFIRRVRKETPEVSSYRRAVRARAHRHFAGAVEPSHWNRVGGWFIKLSGGSYGDHRDWTDIDAWADGIARELKAEAGNG